MYVIGKGVCCTGGVRVCVCKAVRVCLQVGACEPARGCVGVCLVKQYLV